MPLLPWTNRQTYLRKRDGHNAANGAFLVFPIGNVHRIKNTRGIHVVTQDEVNVVTVPSVSTPPISGYIFDTSPRDFHLLLLLLFLLLLTACRTSRTCRFPLLRGHSSVRSAGLCYRECVLCWRVCVLARVMYSVCGDHKSIIHTFLSPSLKFSIDDSFTQIFHRPLKLLRRNFRCWSVRNILLCSKCSK